MLCVPETFKTTQGYTIKPKNMIKSGDQFIAGRSGGVVGAIVPWHGAFAGVAPAHIFYAAGTRDLRVGNLSSKVAYIPNDADLAFFPILGAWPAHGTWQASSWRCRAEKCQAQHALQDFRHILVHCLCCPAARQPSGSRR